MASDNVGNIGMGYRNNYTHRAICPRCQTYSLPIGYPGALSRVDNKTEICSRCGADEGFLDYYYGTLPAIDAWPVKIEFLLEPSVRA